MCVCIFLSLSLSLSLSVSVSLSLSLSHKSGHVAPCAQQPSARVHAAAPSDEGVQAHALRSGVAAAAAAAGDGG
jgi:hypothetical protein